MLYLAGKKNKNTSEMTLDVKWVNNRASDPFDSQVTKLKKVTGIWTLKVQEYYDTFNQLVDSGDIFNQGLTKDKKLVIKPYPPYKNAYELKFSTMGNNLRLAFVVRRTDTVDKVNKIIYRVYAVDYICIGTHNDLELSMKNRAAID